MTWGDRFEVEPEDVAARLDGDGDVTVLDVREPWEVDICAIADSIAIPMGQVPGRLDELPADRPLVVLCHYGARSARVTAWLRQQGFDKAVNMAGGIAAWADRIDTTMGTY